MNAIHDSIPAADSIPSPPTFVEQLKECWQQGRFVCVGLDPVYDRLPDVVRQGRSRGEALVAFNRAIVDATAEWACAFKPNAAFYEAEGVEGSVALARTVAYIKTTHPTIPVIYDAKRGDIGTTNEGYARAAFDELGADAITVHSYFGREALQPFLDRADRGVVIMVSNSHPGAGELQDLPVGNTGEPLFQVIARHVATSWNSNHNCVLVVGATYPDKVADVRRVAPELPLLMLGIGAQGAAIEPAVAAAKDHQGQGLIISSSRAILYASTDRDFANAARRVTQQLHTAINNAR